MRYFTVGNSLLTGRYHSCKYKLEVLTTIKFMISEAIQRELTADNKLASESQWAVDLRSRSQRVVQSFY